MTPDPTLFSASRDYEPLAARMRPQSLEDLLGQDQLLGDGRPLRQAIERGEVGSMVLWGPPGSGKTSLARLFANYTDKHLELFSAVTEGVPRIRQIIAEAQHRLQYEGRGTILFCDEIHRFNKAQQDAFLPWVEDGIITLIGATTENPSFELTSALLSRLRVFVLQPLGADDLQSIIHKALQQINRDRTTDRKPIALLDDATALLVRYADGDARRVLNALEALVDYLGASGQADHDAPITADVVAAVLEKRIARYDKSGEEHFNLISALHKAVRGSDVEGALYWLARMVEGGEDVLYIARRVVRMAVEDIGLADPRALEIAVAARDAYAFLGSPEGELALAQAVIYLTAAPKSNRVYEAWSDAQHAAREYPAEAVPLHLRNAPTRLMRELEYGKGYRYDHVEEGTLAAGQTYLPDLLMGSSWYTPTDQGFEAEMKRRLDHWERVRRRGAAGGSGNEPGLARTDAE